MCIGILAAVINRTVKSFVKMKNDRGKWKEKVLKAWSTNPFLGTLLNIINRRIDESDIKIIVNRIATCRLFPDLSDLKLYMRVLQAQNTQLYTDMRTQCAVTSFMYTVISREHRPFEPAQPY